MSGKAPRSKGIRFERMIVNLLRAEGLDAWRVPLSGAARGFKGDVQVRLKSKTLLMEAKCKKDGFKFLYDSLGKNDMLAVMQDFKEPLVLTRLRDMAPMLRKLEALETPKPATETIESPPSIQSNYQSLHMPSSKL